MIQTVTRREYVITCDGCGQAGPAAGTWERVRQVAWTEGWQALTSLCGLGFFTTWLCPSCQQQRAAWSKCKSAA